MRFVEYPTAGPPPALTNELEELVVLTHGAVEATNVERWALQFGAPPAPDLVGALRRSAYETDVVGTIHTLAQRDWERRGEAAVWNGRSDGATWPPACGRHRPVQRRYRR